MLLPWRPAVCMQENQDVSVRRLRPGIHLPRAAPARRHHSRARFCCHLRGPGATSAAGNPQTTPLACEAACTARIRPLPVLAAAVHHNDLVHWRLQLPQVVYALLYLPLLIQCLPQGSMRLSSGLSAWLAMVCHVTHKPCSAHGPSPV